MHDLWLDLRTATRSLAREPAFAASVVLTLALALGAVTAVVSVLDPLLLAPLPFPEAERLVDITETVEREEVEERGFSFPDFLDIATGTRSFDAVAAWDGASYTLEASHDGGAGAERVRGEVVSPRYLSLLGVEPVVGRALGGDPLLGEADEVVVSHALWQRRWAGDPDVVGTSLEVDGEPATVVGVAPPGFAGLSDEAELWVPAARLSEGARTRRGSRWLSVLARLAPGSGLEAAREEVSAVFRGLEEAYPDTNLRYGGRVTPLSEELFGDFRRPLLLLLGAVAVVLAIACANVANLLLVRLAARRHEVAVRAALGAGRLRLTRQMLAESLLLTAAGGALGALLAAWSVELLTARGPLALPRFADVGIDLRVLAASAATMLAVALALGLATAARTAATPPAGALSAGGRGEVGFYSESRGRALLLAGQVALALVLSVGAGLLAATLRELAAEDMGLGLGDADLLAFEVDLAGRVDSQEEILAKREEIRSTLAALPGVEGVALAGAAPLGGSQGSLLALEGQAPPGPDEEVPYGGAIRYYFHAVEPGYFRTLGVPLLSGRVFGRQDRLDSPGVAVIDEAMARRHFAGRDPVGLRFKFGEPIAATGDGARTADGDEIEWVTIVGVVPEVRQRSVAGPREDDPTDPDVYFSMRQFEGFRNFEVMVRAERPRALVPQIEEKLSRVTAGAPVYAFETLGERRSEDTARSRFLGLLLGLFALLATGLAAVGVYGLLAYGVARRTREIGVRMALGAGAREVLAAVTLEGLAPVAAGLAAGLALSWALTRLLEGFLGGLLYEVPATDPASWLLATASLAAVALAAASLPARRAVRVDPAVALRRG